ncbi:hypothetical protein WJX74_001959 [Apatococcus lobatus]|uniref:Uncharacterized protein n=2 Tax=Apatococcus TaxID=904362 RepID=A0AAW1SLH9_9CHLO
MLAAVTRRCTSSSVLVQRRSCSSGGEETVLAKVVEKSLEDLGAHLQKLRHALEALRTDLAAQQTELRSDFQALRGDFRELRGWATATMVVNVGAYMAPTVAFTALAHAHGFFDAVKEQPRLARVEDSD